MKIQNFKHYCPQIFKDYPFLLNIDLVENTKAKSFLGLFWTIHPKTKHITIELTSKVLNMHEGHIKETFIHELCHAVAYYYYNEYIGHGKVFKKLFSYYTGVDKQMIRRYHQGIFDEQGNVKLRFLPLEQMQKRLYEKV